jgi:thymidylate synthase ThyX
MLPKRLSPFAHAEAREIAREMLVELVKRVPVLFSGLGDA